MMAGLTYHLEGSVPFDAVSSVQSTIMRANSQVGNRILTRQFNGDFHFVAGDNKDFTGDRKKKNFIRKFTALDAVAITPPYLTRHISSLCLLFVSFMTSLKKQ